ncbi:hypothetical protein B296_00053011 [Ensete ventricosum]|uniref:Uncharacterized protein n=1 Tax=Ensete ventricosum TaxID=4639 RepID=A0A426Y9X2_ENSVE|nr:hypothetical protein B296_00053011 [Ensete ventricosum]
MASHHNSQDGNTWYGAEQDTSSLAKRTNKLTKAVVAIKRLRATPREQKRLAAVHPEWSAKRWFNPTRCRLPGDPHERPRANYPVTHAYDLAQSYRVK